MGEFPLSGDIAALIVETISLVDSYTFYNVSEECIQRMAKRNGSPAERYYLDHNVHASFICQSHI